MPRYIVKMEQTDCPVCGYEHVGERQLAISADWDGSLFAYCGHTTCHAVIPIVVAEEESY